MTATIDKHPTAPVLVAAIGDSLTLPRQFQGVFEVLPFQLTFEDDSILDGDEFTVDATVTGVALGDFVHVAPQTDLADLDLVAYVTAADTITVQLKNMTGGTLTTFASGIVLNGYVLRIKAAILDELK